MMYREKKRCPHCNGEIGMFKRMTMLNAICLLVGRLVVVFALFVLAMFIFKWLGKVCSLGFDWAYDVISAKYITFLVIVALAAVVAIIAHVLKNKNERDYGAYIVNAEEVESYGTASPNRTSPVEVVDYRSYD